MVKTPDEIKQTDDLKEIKAAIKQRVLRISKEVAVEYKHLKVESDYPFTTLRIKRADDEYNSLSIEVIRELRDALNILSDDPNIKILFITGNDRVFSTGADVKQIRNLDLWEVRDLAHRGKEVFQRLEEIDYVTIALVNGLALGGGLELAMCCDFRIASPKARFGLVEAKIGLIPGWGGTQRLPRIVGIPRALEMVYTGDTIRAEEALQLGLVQVLIDKDEDLAEAGRKFAQRFLKLSRVTLMLGKRAVRIGFEMPLSYGDAFESELFTLAWASKDRKEGIDALFEKRKPEFKDE